MTEQQQPSTQGRSNPGDAEDPQSAQLGFLSSFMSQPKRLTFSWFQGISSVHHLFLQPPTSPRRIHTLLFILGWPKHLFRFSVPSYSKTRMNVLANPIHLHPLDATLPMY